MIYNIKPVAKPRMTQRDKWEKRKCVVEYWAFKDECKLKKVMLKDHDSVLFIIPMPKSWSKKKKEEMNGNLHKQKPDLDNLLKGLMDAVFDDDSALSSVSGLMKVWGENGAIIING